MLGSDLYQRTISQNYPSLDIAELMKEVWSPTPWMIDVITEGREDEIWHWCYRNLGAESSPIHRKEGTWHRASVTMLGKTWYGFKTEEIMKRFQEKFK